MYSIAEILKANENYEIEKEKLSQLSTTVRGINDNLDLEEVKLSLNYAQIKELYRLILSRNNNHERLGILKEIMINKKILEHPQLNDVHYFPAISEINFISNEAAIALDILIKSAYKNRRALQQLRDMDSQIIDFLIEKSIIEKVYIFHCTCESDECSDEEISQEMFDKLKAYWKKGEDGEETTKEEDNSINYGCFETGCWNDGTVEICSLKDFDEHLIRIDYKVKVKPDMTLDNL